MAAPPTLWRQYWIFQANPKLYDISSELQLGAQVDWFVTRFIEQYRDGDIVYLWQAGEDAGLRGWGQIVGPVYEQSDARKRIPVVYRGVFAMPISKTDLLGKPRVFDSLTVLRNATGANFRITVDEVQALNALIVETEQTPPENPQTQSVNGDEFIVASYLFDYRYDKASKAILANTLIAARAINNTVFPKLLIQATLVYLNARLQAKSPEPEISTLVEKLPFINLGEQLNFASVLIETADYQLRSMMAEGLLVKATTLKLLASARRIAVKTTGKEQIQLRHLLGACLQGTTASFQNYMQDLLSPLSLDLPGARQQFQDYVSEQFSGDRQAAWPLLLSEPLLIESEVRTFVPLITPLDSDSAEEASEDYLNIDGDAIALAKILCAKDAAPPLAIGLFGEWGSGKTFFMRRLRSHVNQLTEGLVSSDSQAQAVYCGKVAQIWFNAWHYQEGNLWASMVSHVFSGLKQELRRLNENTAETEFRELMKKLDDDRIKERELQLSALHIRDLNDKSLKLSNEIASLEGDASKMKHDAELKPNVHFSIIEALSKYGGDIETIFNRPGLANELNKISESANELQAFINLWMQAPITEKLKCWLRFLSVNRWYLLLLVLVSCLVIWGGKIVMIDGLMMKGMGLSLLSLISGSGAAFFSRFGKIVRLISRLKTDVESNEQAAQQEREEKLQKLRIEQQKTLAALKQAQQKHDTLNTDYKRKGDEAFASFVFSRAVSEDYTSQLGILNTVRRDFSRLNELLLEQKDSKLPKLNRIVLYIDDLDRCEPKVVVEVLQAIHLMLAFPLFMVVVGVDARWLGRSLKKLYPFLVHEKDQPPASQALHAASTHDYLEKIIQVPFWLQPLDADRAGGMLEKLLKKKTAVPISTTPEAENHDSDQQANDTELFEDSEDQESEYQDNSETEDATSKSSLITASLTSPDALQMGEHELKFIRNLGGLVGRSPRAVKRFVNLYRILKASQARAQVAGFTEVDGEFRVPLILLAALCGFPKEAADWFKALAAAPPSETLDTLIPVDQPQLSAELKRIGALAGITVVLAQEWLAPVARFGYREWQR